MRNTISPTKEFVGHSKGVIAMSWCPNDSSFLLTCAKDNRTLCWDTVTGEIVCELPASTNWNFDIHWYPKIPGVISASSFDGKIGIYNIEACSRISSADGEFGGALSTGGSSVHLRAPKWLKCPVGVAFGFGGKLATFRPCSGPAGARVNAEVCVHNLVTESSLVSRSTDFETAMRNGDKAALRTLCQNKSGEAQLEDERETWRFLKLMFDVEGTARTELRAHLGFAAPANMSARDDLSQQLEKSLSLDEADKVGVDASIVGKGGQDSFLDNGEDFFNNLESPKAALSEGVVEVTSIPNCEQIEYESEGFSETPGSSFDEAVQHALITGDYKGAISQCISASRMADALVIAHWGGLWESTRDQYLKKSHSSYLKVLSALVGNDLMSLVNTRPLNSWKETLALLCTYARGEEWAFLCDTLASKLMVVGNTLAATLCYICAGNIDKTVEIWSRSLKDDQDGRSYVDRLQDLMERTVVLALATEHKCFNAPIAKLVENYAELLASQGLLTTAMEYLKLLGTDDSSHELAILRDRIAFSVEEKEGIKSFHSDEIQSQQTSVYGSGQSAFYGTDGSNQYQVNSQPQPLGIPSTYSDGYQQSSATSYGANYQPIHPSPQVQEYMNQPFQTAAAPPQLFVPQPISQMQFAATVTATPPVAAFFPAAPPTLRNVEQYQPSSLASHVYSGNSIPSFQPGMSNTVKHGPSGPQPTSFMPNKMPSQIAAPAPASMGFTPVTNQGYVQRPVQPSSSVQTTEAQSTAVPPATGQGPPPTMETVDTSKVSAQYRPVIETLMRLYQDTSKALGAPNAVGAKKREIDDNSRRIASLFAKLNSADISSTAASKLVQLCQALDKGDISGALHIQVLLTTSDWDECNYWLSALKRMIKMKQNVR